MAEHGGDHTVNGSVELEAMRKEDFSWHPCQVSLSPNGIGLVIKYGDDCLEDLIVDKEVALTRLRVRSSPLQGTDCSLVKEGDRVLATKQSQSKSLFFDAEIEKAQRVRHSARTHCRCTFTVKWLHKDLGDEVLVLPSCAVMKLTTESVHVHPTVFAFFKSFNSSNCFTKLPLPTIYGSVESRLESHEFPEAPIGKIRRSNDVFDKKISENILVGGKVDIEGQIQCREFVTHKMSKTHVQVPSVTEHLRRSSVHGNQLHKDKEAEDSPGVFMFIRDGSVESRSRLSPLAARAALASLVSNFSHSTELFVHKEGEEFGSPPGIAGEHVARHLLRIRKTQDFCMVDDLTTLNGISSKSETASATLVPRHENLFPSSSEEKHQVSDAPFNSEMKGNRDKTHEIADFTSNFTCSPTERKVRLTRSASKRRNEVSHKSLAVTSHEEVKVEPSINRRLTRSALQRNQEVESAEAETATQGSISAKQIECNFVQEGKKTVGSSMNEGITPTEEEKCVFYKLKMNKENIPKKKTPTKNLSSTRRLTRSAAREETKKNDLNSSLSLEQSKLSDHSQSDASEGESNMMDAQKSNSDSIVNEAHSHPAAEKNKINLTHTTAKETEANEDIGWGISINCAGNTKQNNGLKRKAIESTTQQLRFSPRLNSLPWTRSQMKL